MVLQPKIMYHLAAIFSLAVVFYILIPGIGAIRIRSIWRNFRTHRAPLRYLWRKTAGEVAKAVKRRAAAGSEKP